MKEVRFFYAPDVLSVPTLPDEEADHALRVLRLGRGDRLDIIDGKGHLVEAVITEADRKGCRFVVNRVEAMPRLWPCFVHLAVAPTKNVDRMEWMVEKATEIGVDRSTFLDCRYSERRVIRTDRLDRIAVAAMKQSHKFHKPLIDDMVRYAEFVKERAGICGQRSMNFIAHCHDDADLLLDGRDKPFLLDALRSSPWGTDSDFESEAAKFKVQSSNFKVLVGPEGDFSPDEVRLAMSQGYTPVSLGDSRLRTETAALVSVHLMQLAQRR